MHIIIFFRWVDVFVGDSFHLNLRLICGGVWMNLKQVTKINGCISDEANISFGVPQGSILGLMLFSLYVNDLPSRIQDGFISLYADDTAICISDSGPTRLQAKLNS